MMVRVMLPIWLISWAVLLPLTSVNTGVSGHSGLDMFIFGNIGTTQQDRYAGHLYSPGYSRVRFKVADLRLFSDISHLIVWIWWNIKHEMAHYVRVRQHYLVSSSHSSTAQACTVLVTGIPPKYLSESALTRLFSHLPGGVRKVWINRDLGICPTYTTAIEGVQMLESAETSLLNTAIKRNNKKLKKAAKSGEAGKKAQTLSSPNLQAIRRLERPSSRSWYPRPSALRIGYPFSLGCLLHSPLGKESRHN
jgi:hypothetical protein